jgi:hypothetical protein
VGAFLDNLRYLTGSVSTKVQPLQHLGTVQPLTLDTEPHLRTLEAPAVFVGRAVDYAINVEKPIDYNKEL